MQWGGWESLETFRGHFQPNFNYLGDFRFSLDGLYGRARLWSRPGQSALWLFAPSHDGNPICNELGEGLDRNLTAADFSILPEKRI